MRTAGEPSSPTASSREPRIRKARAGRAIWPIRAAWPSRLRGWQLFAKVNNVFGKRYATAASLAEKPVAADGSFLSDFAAWLALRYVFGGQ